MKQDKLSGFVAAIENGYELKMALMASIAEAQLSKAKSRGQN